MVTGNWGNDLTLLVKAVREIGLARSSGTFYGNALGVPAALGDAGVGTVLAVSEWHPNADAPGSPALVWKAFRERFPDPRRLPASAHAGAGGDAGAGDGEGGQRAPGGRGRGSRGLTLDVGRLVNLPMRPDAGRRSPTAAALDRQRDGPRGQPGVAHDVEGSGYGFRTMARFAAPG